MSLFTRLIRALSAPIQAAVRRAWPAGDNANPAVADANSADSRETEAHRHQLKQICDSLDCFVRFPTPARYLEVACMYGKTAFWLAERYPELAVWAFDFSQGFVDATRKANPIGDRLTLWQGDATDIHLDGERFDAFFDLVTCIDVTEHLPDDVYVRMLAELARVTKPGGHLLIMQGNTVHLEHIHVLPESVLIADVTKAGFERLATLPERHHLFRREGTST